MLVMGGTNCVSISSRLMFFSPQDLFGDFGARKKKLFQVLVESVSFFPLKKSLDFFLCSKLKETKGKAITKTEAKELGIFGVFFFGPRSSWELKTCSGKSLLEPLLEPK